MRSLCSRSSEALKGDVSIPGDKSISHRALILGASAVGETRISGLLEGDDVLATAAALRCLGAGVERGADGVWHVQGRGVGGFDEPSAVLDMGNSGTAARLIIGLVASQPFTSFFSGDASLRARPMKRIIEPLAKIGAAFQAREGSRLPLAVSGAQDPIPIAYTLPVASAQVKSAILFAALNTPGRTTVVEAQPTRDHSELMLRHFGAEVTVENTAEGGRVISLAGHPEITGQDIVVPGDPSSAAFPVVAALLVAGSRLTVRGVGVNPLRAGLLDCLREMGAGLTMSEARQVGGESVVDLTVEAGPLKGIDVPASRAPTMIDEYPILAVAAACADGVSRMHGLGELRVKESDRLQAMAEGLAQAGVKVETDADTLIVHGRGHPPPGGCTIATNLDHRIAMAFLVLGMTSTEPVAIDDAGPIDTSFPSFVALMNGLGARIGDGTP
ncbi:MAG: 3-phosphoshikimate 1-carboxyvinyltransferase [Rhodospirillales bacterium]|nr:3-phosphoshikimate 1-carboxyvinyltransferase [Rhodospirillales bacterium]